METHDRPSGERPEESQSGASTEASSASGISVPAGDPGGAQAWPPPGQEPYRATSGGSVPTGETPRYGGGAGFGGFGEPGHDTQTLLQPGTPSWWTPRRRLAAGGVALALVLGGGIAGGAVAA